jgi:tRNA-uridine 2-sulfurtransferase
MKRVVVGLSGGVDSSVAAWLLKEEGYEVIGIFMRNWHDESVTISDECPWIEDSNDALAIAETLGIPFQVLDLSKDYKERIVDYMFSEYEKGRTPNPDILCNREIKFDSFLNAALDLKADYIATGHYCQKSSFVADNGETIYQLKAGADGNKDQSYFLCNVSQAQLKHALFPIGHLTKPEVRAIAKREGLVTAEKKDSQGLCFVGKVKLPIFLQQQLKIKAGDTIEIDAAVAAQKSTVGSENLETAATPSRYTREDGIKVGEHQGAHFYTIGQRKGLHIGGRPRPSFVLSTDIENNIVYSGQGDEHPGLYRKALKIARNEVHWIREDLQLAVGNQHRYLVRIRYRQALEEATLLLTEEFLYINFVRPQRGVAAGQFAAWYDGNELIGSGAIFS